ncbi:MAG: M67 family metallopeptidase [Planctomycetes bacterium]|nr:M67 family metallopeptidase [Planctomycetota bacterium]
MSLYIRQTDLDRLLGETRAALPEECCGLLIGRREGGDTHVDCIIRAGNIAKGDRSKNYQIDWRTLFETVRRVRNDQKEIIGFYHSHPDGSAKPSTTDTESAWIDHAYIIVPAGKHRQSAPVSWRIPAGGTRFEKERIVVG